MRIFKTTWFSRLAAKEGISDEELKALVDSLEHGEAEADLGGGVYKQRIARAGGGKSGGYRVIVYFKSEYRSFFVYGYAKSDRENINKNELKYFKNAAK
ncbi:MAG: type II toxin-antitoxin system RelE/ParE family toxin, partial [Spirochaetaceae bacterium]|nr:type II toxin-antitoxin system RelE/ParE family toxin [Spirochaetaceae bacterium]